MEYAPNYQTTVAHYKFDNLIEATYKLEDISTMERVHRWIAGFNMVDKKPYSGFGPGTFYPHYMGFTVTSFQTYVSHNPEKSGIHNNYLMVFVEQGVFGFLILLCICIIPIIIGERTYHALSVPWQKSLVMAATISIILVDCVLLMNDMLQADKVGPLFFLSIAIIVIYAIHVKSTKHNIV